MALAPREGESAADLMAGLGDDPLALERAEYEAKKKALEEAKKKEAALNLFGGGDVEEDVGGARKGLRKRAVVEEDITVNLASSDQNAEMREKILAKQLATKKMEEEQKAARNEELRLAEEERLARIKSKTTLKKVEVTETKTSWDDDSEDLEAAELRRKMRMKGEEEEKIVVDPDAVRRMLEEQNQAAAAREAELEAEAAARAAQAAEMDDAMAAYEREKVGLLRLFPLEAVHVLTVQSEIL
jgi:hypothetical protein